MSELDEMRVFVNLVEAQSSTKAAERMGLAVSAISRRMKELESRLGVNLVQRTTRRMNLTDDGRFFYARCKQILEDMHEAEIQVSRAAQTLKGTIRISTPLSFGIAHIAPAIADFMQQHEEVDINLDMTDRKVDMVEEGFDLTIRVGELQDSSLMARKLAMVHHVVCCSPAFIEQYGPINSPDDLHDKPALCYANLKQPERWRYVDERGEQQMVKVRPRLLSTNGDALREAAVAGLGVLCEPSFIVHKAVEAGTLLPQLTYLRWYDMNVYALYPQTRHLSLRVRALIDFLVARFEGTPPWERFLKS